MGGVLGASWGVMGVPEGCFRRLLGAPGASWAVLGASWARFSGQQADKARHSFLYTIFDRFLFDFTTENRSLNFEKTLKSVRKILLFAFRQFYNNIDSGCEFGAILRPKKPPKSRFGRRLGASWGRLGGVLGASWGPLGASWWPPGRLLVANMAPTWLPKRSPNRSKIEAKINKFLNASWDQIFEGFWCILEGKIEPSWHPKTIKSKPPL